MGDFSVKATLSAVDKNFASTMKGAVGYANNLKSTITSGFGFGIMMGAGQKAFQSISSGVTGLIGEMNSAGAAWKTFQGNMEMNGKTADEIKSIKNELSDFATKTIYSASDMASTFAQLDAVGTKNTTSLVKGFGGLAAAAENPTQAMKTLSQQATQMAAKPTVAWQDFKLMLEQTPAGIAAVAKTMGMSTTDLIKNIQDGTVATEDFLDAVARTGTNADFTKLATEYKTVGQAVDGLTETMTTKLQPAFDLVSGYGISAISKITDSFDAIDGEALVGKITSLVDKVTPYWNVFKENVIQVKDAFGDAFSAIGGSLSELNGAFGTTENISRFSTIVETAAGALKKFAGFMEEHADVIAKVITVLPKLLVAYKGFKIVRAVAPFVGMFTGAIGGLVKMGLSRLAPNLFSVSKGQDAVGKSSGASSKKMLASAKAFMMLGAGVLMISAGFYLLAQSAVAVANSGPLAVGVLAGLVIVVAALSVGMIKMLSSMSGGTKKLATMSTAMLALGASVLLISVGFALLAYSAIKLADAGPLAIGVMVGMVAAVALLAAGAAALGPSLTAGAAGFVAFGIAIALVGVGALLAATALVLISSVLPEVVQYGAQGAVAIAQLALGMTAFALGAALAGVGCVVLGAGLAIVGIGLAVVGVAVLVVAAGVMLLAAGAVVLGAGLLLTGAALMIVASTLPMVAAGALMSTVALAAMLVTSLLLSASLLLLSVPLLLIGPAFLLASAGAVAFGIAMAAGAVGVGAMALALKTVNSSMKSIASNAKSAQKSISSMKASVNIVSDGLEALGSKAKSVVGKIIDSFSSASEKAKSAATTMMNGFNAGITSGGIIAVASANNISNSVVAALGTAESGAYNCGYYIGIGLANGMNATLGYVRAVATQLAAAAEEAVIAKSKIGSPSRVFKKLGAFIGEGFAIGIDSMSKTVERVSDNMVSIPDVPSFAGIGSFSFGNRELSNDYTYNPTVYVQAEVTSIMDGREVGYGTAKYVDEKNNFDSNRKNRLGGKVNV